MGTNQSKPSEFKSLKTDPKKRKQELEKVVESVLPTGITTDGQRISDFNLDALVMDHDVAKSESCASQ